MGAAQRWGASSTAVEVLRRASDSPERNTARLARRSLLAAQDPDAVAATAADLSSADWERRFNAVADIGLAGPAARVHVRRILSVAESFPPAIKWHLVPEALGQLGGTESGNALAAMLNSPGYDILAVIAACAKIHSDAAPAASALREIALKNPFLGDASAAARALKSVTGESVQPPPRRCPSSVFAGSTSYIVELSTGPLRLKRIDVGHKESSLSGRRASAGACAPWIGSGGAYVGLETGDTCLLGVNHGEWGGWLEAWRRDTGARELIDTTNPILFVPERAGATLLLSGISHMAAGVSWVDRVRRREDGHWQSDPLVALGGYPVAWDMRDDQLLLLLAANDRECRAPFVAVRISADGRLTPME